MVSVTKTVDGIWVEIMLALEVIERVLRSPLTIVEV